jgi:membrane-bound lytic murein transglycosylase D
MHRLVMIALAALVLFPLPMRADDGETFPKPPPLVPRVAFWKRIYTEVDTGAGLIHDADDLSIVYEEMHVPKGLPSRVLERRVRERERHYEAILRDLARGRRSGLSAEEARVLALFPPNVSNSTLHRASRNVRFQLGQADKFQAGLVRMGRWEGYMRKIFTERDLPSQLVALPHVESSFNPEARSHVGASGIWQFTRSTGRLFMRIDNVVDERNDPFLATVAAARLLRSDYDKVHTWPLAITAYNHGAAGVARAVERLGTRDIGVIVDRYQSRSFGFASQNFYSEFLAAKEVEEDPERYFGPIVKDPPENPEIVILDHFYRVRTLAEAFRVGIDDLRAANPDLLEPVWSGQKYVPKGQVLRIPRDPLRAAPKVILASIPESERLNDQTPDIRYRVRRGDTLGAIAYRFHVSQTSLAVANGISDPRRLRVGQVLKLPVTASARVVAVDTVPPPTVSEGVYRVRRGDTLSSIARRFGVSERDLASVNRLRHRNRIVVGQDLQLPEGASDGRHSARETTGGIYTVRRGDTLYAIARRFGVTTGDLVALNDLSDRSHIRPGQRLRIPSPDTETASADQ